MKTSQKGFVAPLLFVIIAVLLAGGAYAYMQKNQSRIENVLLPETTSATQTQTTPITQTSNSQIADWKTYTKYGFEFQYPSQYSPYETGAKILFQKRNDEVNWGITISVNTLGANESCDSEKYATNQKLSMAGDSITSKQVLLSGISKEVSQLRVVYGTLTPSLSTYIPTKDCLTSRKMLVISASEKMSEYNQFLQTIK